MIKLVNVEQLSDDLFVDIVEIEAKLKQSFDDYLEVYKTNCPQQNTAEITFSPNIFKFVVRDFVVICEFADDDIDTILDFECFNFGEEMPELVDIEYPSEMKYVRLENYYKGLDGLNLKSVIR